CPSSSIGRLRSSAADLRSASSPRSRCSGGTLSKHKRPRPGQWQDAPDRSRHNAQRKRHAATKGRSMMEKRTRFVTGCLVALIARSEVMAADCIRDSYGNVVCGKGQCAPDQYAEVFCAKEGGGAVKDR